MINDMKRNKSKTILLFAVLAAVLSGCEDDIVKRDIDNAYTGDPSKLPTLTAGSPSAVTYESAVLSASLSGGSDEVTEAGFLYSQDESFATFSVAAGRLSEGTVTATLTGLPPLTTCYAKVYAVSKGNGTAYSDNSFSFTTLKAPEFEDTYLFGTYSTTDYLLENGEPEDGAYDVEIARVGNLYDRITITNLWGGEETITATVNFVNKTITTDRNSIVYVHPDYGNCWILGMNLISEEYYLPSAVATYDEAGKIVFESWSATVAAGDFGFYRTVLIKK
jgi:hypothetical protein